VAAAVCLAGCNRHTDAGDNVVANADYAADNLEAVADNTSNSNAASANSAAADPVTYCPRLDEQVPASTCAWFTDIKKHLPGGTGVFNPPQRMYRGETETVEFSLVAGSDDAPAEAQVETAGRNVQHVETPITPRMAAELKGEGFRIEPAGRQEQDLGAAGSGYWSWQVTALPGQRHFLVLRAFAFAKGPGKAPRQVWAETLHREVTVPIRTRDRVSDFVDSSTSWFGRLSIWLKALAGLIVAAGAVWAAIRYFGKKQSQA
jgi:hypothetical protein